MTDKPDDNPRPGPKGIEGLTPAGDAYACSIPTTMAMGDRSTGIRMVLSSESARHQRHCPGHEAFRLRGAAVAIPEDLMETGAAP